MPRVRTIRVVHVVFIMTPSIHWYEKKIFENLEMGILAFLGVLHSYLFLLVLFKPESSLFFLF